MRKKFDVNGIPAILWGEPSDQLYLFVHGKMSSKEAAEQFASIALEKGYQTLSFDLAQHGERTDETKLDVFSGIHDLNAAADYAFSHWKHISLYACSIGAYFSLQTYADRLFEKALFQSPIVDMKWLVEHHPGGTQGKGRDRYAYRSPALGLLPVYSGPPRGKVAHPHGHPVRRQG